MCLPQRLCKGGAPINLAPNYCSRARVIPGNAWLLTSPEGSSSLLGARTDTSLPCGPAVSRVTFFYPPTPTPRAGSPGRRRVVGAPRSGDAVRPGARAALSPRRLTRGRAAGGDLRGPAGRLALAAAVSSSDRNRRPFRYAKLSTKDCPFSSFGAGRDPRGGRAGAPWAGPGVGGPGGGAPASRGLRARRPAPARGAAASPPQCCYANQVTSPPRAR